jgi:predicted GH43/DUF377 family glycosyl hydrolase
MMRLAVCYRGVAVMLLVAAGALFSNVLTTGAGTSAGWRKYASNPVIGGKLGTVFDVTVLKEKDKYRMWASWRPKKSIALFESSDGMHWGEPTIVLGPTNSGWEDDVNRPGIVKRSDGYHLWYTGQAHGHSWIGYAISRDGRNWKRVGKLPVLSAGAPWEKVAVMCPQVIWDDAQQEYRMWYSGGEQYEPDAIGYATSKDGIHWTKYAANPIFRADPHTLWERDKVTAAQVLQHAGWFYMFYIGFRDVDHAQIGIARSRGGISGWERLPQNPIIGPDENAWDADACYKPWVTFDQDRWLLWYNGRRGAVEQIGLAIHDGEDLGFGKGARQSGGSAAVARTDPHPIIDARSFLPYVQQFNREDDHKFPTMIGDDRAWKWMADNIPRFDAPDAELVRTYYFRWWSYRKHIRKTPVGYVISEFLPDVDWAGRYNTIDCAAGQHIYEGRWLRDRKYIDDYSRFWFGGGGNPRLYSFWAADAMYAKYLADGDKQFVTALLPELVVNYKDWERTNLSSDGLYWQIDDRDGMEKSIGGSGYRPTINSYMYGDAVAIAKIAKLKGDSATENEFLARAQTLRNAVEHELWNPAADFYETRSRKTGKLVDVRELIGYVPWYFDLPSSGHEAAWKQLFDPEGFAGQFGPTTAERRSPRFMFRDPHECLWNGPSWPFATTQTLVAMANLLNSYKQSYVDKADYFRLLEIYAHSQTRTLRSGETIPWIDEDLNADTGKWIARTILHQENRPDQDRGEYYNHSAFADLVITGLVGLRPRADDTIEVNPLLPAGVWKYFALDSIPYHGWLVSIIYDADGKHYGRGKGLRILVDGATVASSATLTRLVAHMPASPSCR